jgi:4-aminobutyrate aminotransferase
MDWPPGSHASTFGGNPVSCRAALATIDLVEREYLANAAARGDDLRSGLESLAREFPTRLAEPRGLGLMQAIDVLDPATGLPEPDHRNALIQTAFRRGLLLLGCGRAAVRFCPPLCVTREEVARATEILRECLRA